MKYIKNYLLFLFTIFLFGCSNSEYNGLVIYVICTPDTTSNKIIFRPDENDNDFNVTVCGKADTKLHLQQFASVKLLINQPSEELIKAYEENKKDTKSLIRMHEPQPTIQLILKLSNDEALKYQDWTKKHANLNSVMIYKGKVLNIFSTKESTSGVISIYFDTDIILAKKVEREFKAFIDNKENNKSDLN